MRKALACAKVLNVARSQVEHIKRDAVSMKLPHLVVTETLRHTRFPRAEFRIMDYWHAATMRRPPEDSFTIPPQGTSFPPHSPLPTRFSPLPTHPRPSPLVSPLPTGLAPRDQITSVSALPLPSPEIRISIPTAIQHASMNDPPYEKNGSGIPVIGIRFNVIPTLTSTCTNHVLTNPNATKLENESVARPAILTHRKNSQRKRTRATVTPTNPSSSPTTGKRKSVCCAGRNASRFCVPIVNPFPSHPPDPIATCD